MPLIQTVKQVLVFDSHVSVWDSHVSVSVLISHGCVSVSVSDKLASDATLVNLSNQFLRAQNDLRFPQLAFMYHGHTKQHDLV